MNVTIFLDWSCFGLDDASLGRVHDPITTLTDGTIKQVSPFNGTQVWTVPGRANRPFVNKDLPASSINHDEDGRHCSFCELRYLDSPPEHSRLVAFGDDYQELTQLSAAQLNDTVAAFRRVPNLFPILPLSYWQANYGMRLSADAQRWFANYANDPAGFAHLLGIARRVGLASGLSESQWNDLSVESKLARAETFFGSCHDLIIAHRHFMAGAQFNDQLESSGSLSVVEHRAYQRFTIEAAQSLLTDNPFAKYVAIFQNWLRPAGASFDHLHKQLAAIDQLPVQLERELHHLRRNPDLYQQYGVEYAQRRGLVIAHNDYAVAFAGYGHRHPSLEVHSLAPVGRPWELTTPQLNGLSDLVHGLHLASGGQTPLNEEWHYQPPGIELVSPVRVVIKWRTNNLAGFEGATKIYLNTISPWDLRDRVLTGLSEHRARLGEINFDPGSISSG